jgi:hypothetical protein
LAEQVVIGLEEDLEVTSAQDPPQPIRLRGQHSSVEGENFEERELLVDIKGNRSDDEVLVLARIAPTEEQASGEHHGDSFQANLSAPVVIRVAAVGFEVQYRAWEELPLVPGRSTPLIAFRLRVAKRAKKWRVIVTVHQGDGLLARVDISEFPLGTVRRQLGPPDKTTADLLVWVDDQNAVQIITSSTVATCAPASSPWP